MSGPGRSAARRWGASLAVALAAALAVAGVLLAGAMREVRRSAGERRAIVSVRALTDVVRLSGGGGGAVREAVRKWQDANPAISAIRVIAFDGISLEASTALSDTGEKAAPRPLALDEKPLYDQGQRLRAAIETNEQEGAPRKDEIESELVGPGRWRIAAPIETGGETTGMLSLETPRPPPPKKLPLAAMAAALSAPLA
ncbi:MAG TPA: sugar ABC transporter permease, partial [Thermoanaerobaculia bacterium]|nr:sugar ABC transporter permease [Thermoanaerobaculia bacterium]